MRANLLWDKPSGTCDLSLWRPLGLSPPIEGAWMALVLEHSPSFDDYVSITCIYNCFKVKMKCSSLWMLSVLENRWMVGNLWEIKKSSLKALQTSEWLSNPLYWGKYRSFSSCHRYNVEIPWQEGPAHKMISVYYLILQNICHTGPGEQLQTLPGLTMIAMLTGLLYFGEIWTGGVDVYVCMGTYSTAWFNFTWTT